MVLVVFFGVVFAYAAYATWRADDLRRRHVQTMAPTTPYASYQSLDTVAKFQGSSHAHLKEPNPRPLCQPVLRVVVMTMNRPASLKRLLASLAKANYNGDCVHINIWIDKNTTGNIHQDTKTAADNFEWPHGHKNVNVPTRHLGLRGQWLETWNASVPGGLTPSTPEKVIMLEDDLEVAADFWKWLKLGHSKYGTRDDIAGFTLQRASLCVNQCADLRGGPVSDNSVFLYALVGAWGFSPLAKHWCRFTTWAREFVVSEGVVKPYVADTQLTSWYKAFERQGRCPGRNCMWTQLHHYYTTLHADRYTVYAKCTLGQSLAVNHKEPGLHYSKKLTQSEDLARAPLPSVLFEFPEDLPIVSWDGMLVTEPHTQSTQITVASFPRPEPEGVQDQHNGAIDFESVIMSKTGVYAAPILRYEALARVIVVTAANDAFFGMLQNWEALAAKFGYKWLVVALDRDIYHRLGPAQSVPSFVASGDGASVWPIASHADIVVGENRYGTRGFNAISAHKIKSVLGLLRRGLDVVFCDPDNVILLDIFRPDSELMQLIGSQQFDYLYSVDRPGRPTLTVPEREQLLDACATRAEREGNTGFYYASAKSAALAQVFEHTIQMSNTNKGLDDQTSFWMALRAWPSKQHCNKKHNKNHTEKAPQSTGALSYCCLDPRKFVTGRDVSARSDVETFHANWVIGLRAKIEILRKHVRGGAWVLDRVT